VTNGDDTRRAARLRRAGPGRLRPHRVVITGAVIPLLLVGAACGDGGPASAPRSSPSPSAASTSASPRDDVLKVLRDQADALLRGDEQDWLADIDPNRPRTVERYRNLFRTLRAMRVSGWDVHVGVQPLPAQAHDQRPGRVIVDVAYCFATSPCPKWRRFEPEAPQLTLHVEFVYREGRVMITGLGKRLLGRDPQQPTPWEGGTLTVAEGERVIVGAAGRASRLREAVAVADRAAAVADRFARWGPPPQRYVVYLATTAEWRTWFGGIDRPRVLGYAQRLGRQYQVVINTDRLTPSQIPFQTILLHELGHVVSLTGANGHSLPWLEEGTAEYIAYKGTPWSANPNARPVRQWISDHGWAGTSSLPHHDSTKPKEVDAFYGAAHLMVRCLVAKYGEAAFLTFFDIARRHGQGLTTAATAAFGKSWTEVDTGCITYVRSA
jgi:hypothetical protein